MLMSGLVCEDSLFFLGIYATMYVISLNTQLRHSLCSPTYQFQRCQWEILKVLFYLKLPLNFAAGILLDIAFSATNTHLNDIDMCLHPFLRPHKFGNEKLKSKL